MAANNAITNSGLGRGCAHSVRMRRGPGALTGPGSHTAR
uniref:ErmSV leader peptide n=1 Tax=Streptomyces viridochromogenes TaxID=1938 RepID=O05648_STRVR|nr:ErmSV leader peptide [Streptomyces viridochromogenes]